MSCEIIMDVTGDLTRVALRRGREILEMYIDIRGSEKLAGNIYKGRVQNILPGMQAAFVDIGLEKNAFLYAGDIMVDTADFEDTDESKVEKKLRDQTAIKKMLKVGQELLVQVIKEPGGTKGPRVTTHLTVPGHTCVLVPSVNYVGVSRRIEDEQERARLKTQIEQVKPDGMGVIVRTAAKGLSAQHFERELVALKEQYDRVQARAARVKAPALVYCDESPAYRVVRDMFTDEIDRLIINDEDTWQSARSVARVYAPQLIERIELYKNDLPIFDAYGLESKFKTAMERKVWLKNGGYLVIDQTEALTVIDVNTGSYVGTTADLQQTVFEMNREAAVEIARQVRLRDISGIIIIDFIDMKPEENRQALLEQLRAAFKDDRTKTNIVGLTGLGLVEMTRKKLRKSLSGVAQCTCPMCHGQGRILNAQQVAYGAVREVQRMRAGGYICDLLIEINRYAIDALRTMKDMPGVYYIQNDALGSEQYQVTCVHNSEVLRGAKPLFGKS
jgi:ribonuclease G